MLGKIIKYDIKATARYFIPLYLALGGITLVNKLSLEIFSRTNSSRLAGAIMITLMFLYIMILIGGVFLNYAILTTHFFKNLTGDEGYLTFTLPVKTHTIINGKLITAFLWSLISSIITFLSVLILMSGHGILSEIFGNMTEIMNRIYDYIPKENFITFSALMILSIIIGIFKSILMLYVSIALGQFFGKYKILGCIISYFGLYFLSQIVGFFVTFSTGLFRNLDFDGFKILNTVTFVSLLVTIITTVIYYFLTVYIFDKKLNLE